MKAHLKVRPNLIIEVEAQATAELFELLARAEEIFGETRCGKCGKPNLRFRVRENAGNKFYELLCGDCRAYLEFSPHKQGGQLFSRRMSKKDRGGHREPLPNRGWKKWDAERKEEI